MKDDTLYLVHIYESIVRIEKYLRGVSRVQFFEDSLIQDAVLRNLQILAESTQRLSDEFKDKHQETEWVKIAGLRNILVHDYLGIDVEIVWNIIDKELPELKSAIKDHLPQFP